MKDAILSALQNIHNSFEQQSQSNLPTFGITLSRVMREMGLNPDIFYQDFYDALESLQDEGLIWDESSSNGGFGQYIGGQGEVSRSVGAKIRLAR
ncbi:hypothetical protein [Erwinia sp. E_sp_B04_7]|uniref:hypothetical protein n=1 Tax=unclassified Erwinia TaxID=2622719 RepID=UPI0030D2E156